MLFFLHWKKKSLLSPSFLLFHFFYCRTEIIMFIIKKGCSKDAHKCQTESLFFFFLSSAPHTIMALFFFFCRMFCLFFLANIKSEVAVNSVQHCSFFFFLLFRNLLFFFLFFPCSIPCLVFYYSSLYHFVSRAEFYY